MTPSEKRTVSLILRNVSEGLIQSHITILAFHIREGRLQGVSHEDARAYAVEKGYATKHDFALNERWPT